LTQWWLVNRFFAKGVSWMADSTGRVKLVFAGFHPLVLEDCLVRAGPEYDIVALSAEESTLLPAVNRLHPDVVLLDLLHASSLQTIRRVTAVSPPSRVVALTGMRRRDFADSVLSAGASGVVQRSRTVTELYLAVKAVMSGRRYLSPGFETASRVGTEKRVRHARGPSALDEMVLRMTVKGYPVTHIARALGLSVGTVLLSVAYLKRYCGMRTSRALEDVAVPHDPAPPDWR
jgi:DNA-binding NarL/FixJ family response regulator